MKHFVLAAAFAALGSASSATTIVGYDILNSDPTGTGGWAHNYVGAPATPAASGLPGLVDYIGGTGGTLTDGDLGTSFRNSHLFISANSVANAIVTVFFDQSYSFDLIEIFGGVGSSNNIPGNISGFDLTDGSTTVTVNTTEFGAPSSDSNLVNDRADLTGLGLTGSWLTLSNFQIDDGIGANRFNISEIVVNGQTTMAPIPLPATGWMLIAGIGGLAAFKRRRRPKSTA